MQCLHCGQEVKTVDFRVIPLWPDAVATDPQRVPWECREEIGFWSAWWQTWKLGCFQPTVLGRQLAPGKSWWQALGFAAVTHGLASISSLILAAGFASFNVITRSGTGGGTSVTWSYAFSTFPLFAGWFITLLTMLIAIVGAHAVVMLSGRKRGNWHLTARALCYVQGPHLLAVIPFVSCVPMLGIVWYIIAGTMALREAQRIHTLRALLASAWIIVFAIGLFIWLMFLIISRL